MAQIETPCMGVSTRRVEVALRAIEGDAQKGVSTRGVFVELCSIWETHRRASLHGEVESMAFDVVDVVGERAKSIKKG